MRTGVVPDVKARCGDRVSQKPPGAALAVGADDLNDIFERNFIFNGSICPWEALIVDFFVINRAILQKFFNAVPAQV